MYFAAKMAAKSLTKQIHTEAQKSKFEPWTWLEEILKEIGMKCMYTMYSMCTIYTPNHFRI